MSQENVETLRRLIEAFNRDDVDAADEFTTEDFEFAPYLATELEGRTYKGRAAQREFQADRHAAWEHVEVSIVETRDLGDRVVAFGDLRGRGKTSGAEVQVGLAWVVDFMDGRASRLRSYASPAEALEAAGLRE